MSQAEFIARRTPAASRTFLRSLAQCSCFVDWDARKTIWANRWGLLKVSKGRLKLTELGWKVARHL